MSRRRKSNDDPALKPVPSEILDEFVASGRTLRDHSRSASVPLAGRRPRRRGHRHPAPAPPGSLRRRAVLSQVAQAKRPCPAPPRHRSPRELSRRAPGHHAVRRPRHHALRQQPGRSLTPADAPARAPHAALQIGGTRPAVPRGPRRRSQPVHRWTTSASRRPSATSALARVRYVERRGSGLTRSAPRQRPTCAVVGVNLTVPAAIVTSAGENVFRIVRLDFEEKGPDQL